MIDLDIPGTAALHLSHLVLDFNGTLAIDGVLIPGVEEKLNILAEQLEIHIVTADTFNKATKECAGIKGNLKILESPAGGKEKEAFVLSLGAEKVVAMGNGNNDALMLKKAALGIIAIGKEGASVKALTSGDIVVKDINEGLELLLNKRRLYATLRG